MSGTFTPADDMIEVSTDTVQIDHHYSKGLSIQGPRAIHCVVHINATHAFTAGGLDANQEPTSSAYIIDMTDESRFQWTRVPDMFGARAGHSCNKIGDDIVVVGKHHCICHQSKTGDKPSFYLFKAMESIRIHPSSSTTS